MLSLAVAHENIDPLLAVHHGLAYKYGRGYAVDRGYADPNDPLVRLDNGGIPGDLESIDWGIEPRI